MIGVQLVLLVLVLAAGALGGAIPLRRREAPEQSRLLERGSAFAAGVFLGASFVHMLPDATRAWQELGWTYPMGFLLAALAVLGMLLFEHVLTPEEAHHALHAPSAERFGSGDAHAGHAHAGYAILVALSIHAFLAGLALGAQSELAGALVLFGAIIAHKSVAGFALGVSLVRTAMPTRRAWGMLAIFAAATPAGMVVGAGVGQSLEGAAQLAFEASFLALAAGTFAYVATLDILREEFHAPGGRFAKWAWVCAGTGVMALLALWV